MITNIEQKRRRIVGERIKIHRKDKSFNQTELGRKIKRKKSLISQVEAGKATLNPEQTRKIAIALKVPVLYLLTTTPLRDCLINQKAK